MNLLKLNVFLKWRLGGLRARFWRSQSSFLEGLGSIFQGFGRLIRCLKAFPWWHQRGHRQASRSRLRSVRDLAKPQEFVSSKWPLHRRSAKNAKNAENAKFVIFPGGDNPGLLRRSWLPELRPPSRILKTPKLGDGKFWTDFFKFWALKAKKCRN